MKTYYKIRDIFYSGGLAFTGERDSIDEISFLVDEGYLLLSEIKIATKDEYLNMVTDSEHDKHRADMYDASGGGLTHAILKILTGKYLKNVRNLEIQYEHPFCGYYPDIISKDKTLIAECGHTRNSEKIIAYFRQGKINELIQVPYPDESDLTVTGYGFTAGKDLYDFLDFLHQEKQSKIKEIFDKRVKNQ